MNWRTWLTKRRIVNLVVSIATGWFSTMLWPPTAQDRYLKQPFLAIERLGFDALFAIRGPRYDRVDSRIAIVGFTRESEINLGARWPVKRSLHAQAISNLNADGAALIVFDALFSDASQPSEDKALDEALKRAKNVVIAQRIDRDTVLQRKTLEFPYYDDALGIDFEASTSLGLAEVALDNDEVVRTFVPMIRFQDEWLPTLATAAYMKVNGVSAAQIGSDSERAWIGSQSFRSFASTKDPIDGSPIVNLLVDYPAGVNAFEAPYTYDQVVQGRFAPGAFRGKIVLIGVTGFEQARELDDIYTISSTQLTMQSSDAASARQARSADYSRIPGVFVQAHFLNALLTRGFVDTVPKWIHGLAVAILTLCGTLVANRYMNWRGPVFAIGLALAYIVVSIVLFEYRQTHLPFLVPVLLFSVSVGSISWIERAGLKKRWSGYVSIDVLDEILKSDSDTIAKRHEAVAMFGDIRGFTSFADKHDADTVVRVLNRHFERLEAEIFKEKGAIDKFMGDGILVVFGAPIRIDQPELRAVRSAIRMRDISLVPLRDGEEEYVLATGFGICTGPFVAGHVGSRRRHDFTIIGDVVNTAARLQAVTGKPDVVIDSRTYESIKDSVDVEDLGMLQLKGKELPVQCFRVLKLKEE